MKKYIVGLLLAIAFLGSVSFAHASPLDDLWNEVLSLRQQVVELRTELGAVVNRATAVSANKVDPATYSTMTEAQASVKVIPAGTLPVTTLNSAVLNGRTELPAVSTTSIVPTATVQAVSPITISRTLNFGETSTDIQKIQEYLISTGLLSGEATGYYGNGTKGAIIRFQQQNGISGDGMNIGPKTQEALARLNGGSIPAQGPTGGAAGIQEKIFLLAGDNNYNSISSSGTSQAFKDVWSSGDGINWTQIQAAAQWGNRTKQQAVYFNNKLWVIGGKDHPQQGYNYKNDVWSSVDGVTWTQVTANAPWSARGDHSVVVYQNKLWVMGGYNTNNQPTITATYYNDVWSSPDGINWTNVTAKAPWKERAGASTFVFDNKMWVVSGFSCTGIGPTWQGGCMSMQVDDAWYSTNGSTWTQAASGVPLLARSKAGTAVFNGKIYMSGGFGSGGNSQDVIVSSDGAHWSRVTTTSGWGLRSAHQMVVYAGKLWIVGGFAGFSAASDEWVTSDGINWTQAASSVPWTGRIYHSVIVKPVTIIMPPPVNPPGPVVINTIPRAPSVCALSIWTQKANFPGTERYGAVGFSIDDKLYVGTGEAYGTFMKDFWEYNPATNTWTQKADFPRTSRFSFGFSIGNKGYVGTGQESASGGSKKDFWEYDPATNTWTQKADFGGLERVSGVGFSVGTKGYAGTGLGNSGQSRDFWEYNPATNTWAQKANFGGTVRYEATGFSIGSKGYIGSGLSVSNSTKDFWEYNPATNTWSQKADIGGVARAGAGGFSLGGQGYIGGGNTISNTFLADFWEYNPATNTWSQKADIGGPERYMPVALATSTKGYMMTGYNGYHNNINVNLKDTWEYCSPSASIPASAAKPDLIVDSFTWAPQLPRVTAINPLTAPTPNPNPNFQFTITVKNISTVAAAVLPQGTQFSVSSSGVSYGARQLLTPVTLQPGQTYVMTVYQNSVPNILATARTIDLTATVDDFGPYAFRMVDESNETNNTMGKSFTVLP